METVIKENILETHSGDCSINPVADNSNLINSGNLVESWDLKVTPVKAVRDPSRIPNYAIFIILFCLLSAVTNLRVVWVVIDVPKQRLRPVSILVAHLSTVVLLIAFVAIMFVGGNWDLATLIQPGACQLFSTFRNTLFNVYPLSVASVFQELIKTLPVKNERPVILRLLGIWIIAWLSNLPTTFTGEYEKSSGKCKPVSLYGGFGSTLTYELIKFLLFHVVVAVYIIYAMVRIRLKISYLKIPILLPNNKFHRRLQMIRYIYAHSILFVGLWIPSGLLLALLKIFTGTGFIESVSGVVIPVGFVFLLLSPLVYASLIEKNSVKQFCLGRDDSRQCSGPRVGFVEGRRGGNWNEGDEDAGVGTLADESYFEEISRESTLTKTATLELLPFGAFPVSRHDPGIGDVPITNHL